MSEPTKHPKTECCGYECSIDLRYPVMWNKFNKVVQCHNCGQRWAPTVPSDEIIVLKLRNAMWSCTFQKYQSWKANRVPARQWVGQVLLDYEKCSEVYQITALETVKKMMEALEYCSDKNNDARNKVAQEALDLARKEFNL